MLIAVVAVVVLAAVGAVAFLAGKGKPTTAANAGNVAGASSPVTSPARESFGFSFFFRAVPAAGYRRHGHPRFLPEAERGRAAHRPGRDQQRTELLRKPG